VEQMKGLPEDLIEKLEKADDKHKFISLSYPELFPALAMIKDDEVRH
jgi:hypothetical protein